MSEVLDEINFRFHGLTSGGSYHRQFQDWLRSRGFTIQPAPAVGPEEHRPHRDSDVAAWLRRHRERHDFSAGDGGTNAYCAVDEVLDDYRLHADTGTPLNLDADDGGVGVGCGCGDS